MATCTATHTATHTATRTVPNPNSNISVVLEVIGQVPSDAEIAYRVAKTHRMP